MIPFKKYIIAGVIILFILGLFAGLTKLYLHERKERIRFEGNQSSLLTQMRVYKLADSSNVATIGVLKMTVSELRETSTQDMQDLKTTIGKLDIKLKHIQSATNTNFETVTQINSVLRDSLIFDTIPVKVFNQSTRFNDVSLTIFPNFDDSLELRVITRDTLTQVIHKVPRGIKFWKPRKFEQTIRFANPDTRISYSRYLELSK